MYYVNINSYNIINGKDYESDELYTNYILLSKVARNYDIVNIIVDDIFASFEVDTLWMCKPSAKYDIISLELPNVDDMYYISIIDDVILIGSVRCAIHARHVELADYTSITIAETINHHA